MANVSYGWRSCINCHVNVESTLPGRQPRGRWRLCFVEHLNVLEVIGANTSCYHGVTRFGMRVPLVRVATSKRRKPVTNGRKAGKNGRRPGVDRRRNGVERS